MILIKVFFITIALMTIAGIGYGLNLVYNKIFKLATNSTR